MIFEKYAGQNMPISQADKGFLLMNNQGLVRKLARRFGKLNAARVRNGQEVTWIAMEDLIQSGNIGLLEAIDQYGCTHAAKARFDTFAFWHVRHRISNSIDYGNQLIHVPKMQKMNKGTVKLQFYDNF